MNYEIKNEAEMKEIVNELQENDIVILSSVKALGNNPDEAFEAYNQLINKGVVIVSKKEPNLSMQNLFKQSLYTAYLLCDKEKGSEKMYYATYKNIGRTDIAVFKEKEKRDEWVNFKDPISVSLGVTEDNCTFEREVLETAKASKMLLDKPQKYLPLEKDEYNPGLYWHRMRNAIHRN
ncbi:MAG: hypothetical protein LUH57_00150 [Ruminococcus sp.]|nr:hypothetical protein [Ruminococcus sp.]